jgi:F0F1-type ATP synthase assembly protein I
MRMYAVITSAAMAKFALIGLGYWIGSKIDASLGTSPLFLLLCVGIGLGLGLWGLIRAIDRRGS